MQKISTNKYSLLLFFIYFFLLTNIFRDKLPGGFNQITGMFIILMAFWVIAPIKKGQLYVFSYYLAIILISIAISEDVSNHLKYSVYFLLELTCFYMASSENVLNKLQSKVNRNIRRNSILLMTYSLVLLMMMFNSSCYSTDLWNGAGYFQGFTVPHGVAGSCCLAISLCLIGLINKKVSFYDIFIIGINLIAILKTGARTYLIAAMALLMLFVVVALRNNKYRYIILTIMLTCAFIVVVNSTSFRNKMNYTIAQRSISGFSKIDAFTSSRTIIWAKDLEIFLKSGINVVLFGGGFDYSYAINSSWSYRIQAHNGFLEVLLSTGIIGLIIFVYLLYKYFKSINRVKSKLSTIIMLLFVVLVMIFDDILQAPSYMLSILFVTQTTYQYGFLLRNQREQKIRINNEKAFARR